MGHLKKKSVLQGGGGGSPGILRKGDFFFVTAKDRSLDYYVRTSEEKMRADTVSRRNGGEETSHCETRKQNPEKKGRARASS